VVGNSFTHNGVNSILDRPQNAVISFNNFSGNHYLCPFSAPGGQIDLDVYASGVDVYRNTFENGPSCSNGYWAQGVELHGLNITLTDNIITSNAGEGVYMDGAQNVTITTDSPSSYQIAHNNTRGSGFSGCGGFPGIRVHSSNAQGRATATVAIKNLWSVGGQSWGVEVSSCGTTGPSINNVTIENNCLAGNLNGGIYTPAAGSNLVVLNNQTAGCGGYDLVPSSKQIRTGLPNDNIMIFEHVLVSLANLRSIHRQAFLDLLGLSSASDREFATTMAAQFELEDDAFEEQAYAALSRGDLAAHREIFRQRTDVLVKIGLQLVDGLSVDGASRFREYVEGVAASIPRQGGNSIIGKLN
jgi:Right handed beta helix region